MKTRHQARRHTVRAVAGAVVLTGVVGACGGSTKSSSPSAPTTAASSAPPSVVADSSSSTASYSWSSLGGTLTQADLTKVSLAGADYSVFKGKTVGIVELAPLEPVTRIETDLSKCVTANGGTVKTVDIGGDPAKGVAAVQNFLQQNVAAIWNDALDPGTLASEISTANHRRLPLVTAWSGSSATSVGINGLEGQSASRLAQYLIDRIGGTGTVAMLGSPATQSLRERDAAFLAVAKQYPGIKVVTNDNVNVASPTEDANNSLRAMLQGNPGVTAVWTDFDEIGVGAAQAVQASGSHAFVVSFNGDKGALQDIRDPSSPFAATMANDLEATGDIGCAEIATMLAGGTIPAQNIYLDSPLVTKANVTASGYVHGTGPILLYVAPAAQRWPAK